MEVVVELELDIVEANDWGWNIVSIIIEFHGFFRHRGHRYLPAVPSIW